MAAISARIAELPAALTGTGEDRVRIGRSDAQAAANAIVHSYAAHDVTWCGMLTDGVDDPASHLGIAVED